MFIKIIICIRKFPAQDVKEVLVRMEDREYANPVRADVEKN